VGLAAHLVEPSLSAVRFLPQVTHSCRSFHTYIYIL
jgi:hypothetical protein